MTALFSSQLRKLGWGREVNFLSDGQWMPCNCNRMRGRIGWEFWSDNKNRQTCNQLILMGNNNHIPESSALLGEFQQVRTHPLTNHYEIRHKKTKQLLLVKELSPAHHSHSQNISQLLKRKQSVKSVAVTEVVRWEHLKYDRFCSNRQTFLILFNNAGISLREYLEILTRKRQKLSYDQIYAILESLLKAVKHFQTLNHLHTQINIDSILYDGRRTVLLDPWLTELDPALKNHMIQLYQQNQIVYKSPERQLYEADQISSFDSFKSCLYEIGLLMVDLALDGKYTQIALRQLQMDQQITRFLYESVNIEQLLQEIHDLKLISKLSILLNLNPEKRLIIYSILLPEKLALNQMVVLRQTDNTPSHRRIPTEMSRKSDQKQIKSLRKTSRTNQDRTPSPPKSFLTTSPMPEKKQNYRYHSYQASPLRRSLEKEIFRAQTQEPESMAHNQISPTSSFTYAQLLHTPTKEAEAVSITKNKPPQHSSSLSNWPYPHKIININTNGNINVSINMNLPQKQKQTRKHSMAVQESRITEVSREYRGDHIRTQSMFSNLSIQKLSQINSVNLGDKRKYQNSTFQPSTIQSNLTNNTSFDHSRNNSLQKKWLDVGNPSRMQSTSREKPQFRFQYPSTEKPNHLSSSPLPTHLGRQLTSNAGMNSGPVTKMHPLLLHQQRENTLSGPPTRVTFVTANHGLVSVPTPPTAPQFSSFNCAISQSTQTSPVFNSVEPPGKLLAEQNPPLRQNSRLGHKFTFQRETEQQNILQSPPTPSFNRTLFTFHNATLEFNRHMLPSQQSLSDQMASGFYGQQSAKKGENPDGMDVRMKTKTIESLQQQDQQIYQLPEDNKIMQVNNKLSAQFNRSSQQKDGNEVSYIDVSSPPHNVEQKEYNLVSSQQQILEAKAKGSMSSGISEGTKQVNKQEQEELGKRIQIQPKYDNLNIDSDPNKMSRRSSLSAKETESIIFQNSGKGRAKNGQNMPQKKKQSLQPGKSATNISQTDHVAKAENCVSAFVNSELRSYNSLAKSPITYLNQNKAGLVGDGTIGEAMNRTSNWEADQVSTPMPVCENLQRYANFQGWPSPSPVTQARSTQSQNNQMEVESIAGQVPFFKYNYSQKYPPSVPPSSGLEKKIKRMVSSNPNSITSICKDLKSESPNKNQKTSLYAQGGRLVVSIQNGTETLTESIVEQGFVFGQGKYNVSHPNSKHNSNPNSNSTSKTKMVNDTDQPLFICPSNRAANAPENKAVKSNTSVIDNMEIIEEILSHQLMEHLKDLEESQESKAPQAPNFHPDSALSGGQTKLPHSDTDSAFHRVSGAQLGTLINILDASRNSEPSSIALSQMNLGTNSVPNSSNSISSPPPLVVVHPSVTESSSAHLKYYVVQTYPVSTTLLHPTTISIQLLSSGTMSSHVYGEEKYEGYKQDGMRSGHGTYYYANGCIYEGEWKCDAPHGYGKYYRPAQDVGLTARSRNLINLKDHYEVMCEGFWINGELLNNVNTLNTIEYAADSGMVHSHSNMGSSDDGKFKTSIENKLSVKELQSFSNQQGSGTHMRSLIDNLNTNNDHQNYTSSSIPRFAIDGPPAVSRTSILDSNNSHEPHTVKLKNGDIFKGQLVDDPNSKKMMMGKLFKVNGEVIEGLWPCQGQLDNK